MLTLAFGFTAVGITETWLYDCNCNLYSLPGYILTENHRTHRSGGGVGIYLKDDLEFKIRNDLVQFDDSFESVFIEVANDVFKMGKNIIIGVIYRPPGTDLSLFNSKIADLLEKNKLENKLCYLMGDYNINLLNYETDELTANFVDIVYSYAFVPLINRPTRVSKYSATLIDNILTNNHNALVQCCQGILVIDIDISDHFPIIHINPNCTRCIYIETTLLSKK